MPPPFSSLPPPVARQSLYSPLPQLLQQPARMLPPGQNLYAAQGQHGVAQFQSHGQIPAPPASAPGYHNAQPSQPPQAASSYPNAPGNPNGVGPQHMGAHQPPVHHLPQFPGLPQGILHTYAAQQPSPAAQPSQPLNAPRATPIDANGNRSSEHRETSSGCIGCYNLTNYRGCINTGECTGCNGCVVYLRCTDCHGCVQCIDCTGCQVCVDCIDCVGLKAAIGIRGARMWTAVRNDAR